MDQTTSKVTQSVESGVDVTFDRDSRSVTVTGWTNLTVNLQHRTQPERVTLGQFLSKLGVTLDDCVIALSNGNGNQAE